MAVIHKCNNCVILDDKMTDNNMSFAALRNNSLIYIVY